MSGCRATARGGSAADPFFDHDVWSAILDRGKGVFSGLVPGASIAILPRRVAARNHGDMLLWQVATGGISAGRKVFAGFETCAADVAFVVDDEALARLGDNIADDAVSELRRLVRRGHIVLYFLKCEGALIEAGYEEFLDSLGLTVLGTCR
jgi:hypothetical protein